MPRICDPTDVLPHRPPFLFIDKVLSCDETSVRTIHTFKADSYFFSGHFPHKPIVPGVIILEGMAQALAFLAMQEAHMKNLYLVGIEHARFRKPVFPDQQVEFSVHITHRKLGLWTANAKALIEGLCVAEATIQGMSEV